MPDKGADNTPDRGEQLRVRIGQNIKQLRLRRRMSQEQLAERLGTTGKHVSEAERGATGLSFDLLARLGEVLDIAPFEFLRPAFDERGAPGFALTPEDVEKIDDVIKILERVKRAGARDLRPK